MTMMAVKIEPHKIKGLLDMGVKPVYKLTTEDGRTIRTTGNHPYLVRTSLLSGKTPDNKTSNGKRQQDNNSSNSVTHNLTLSNQEINENNNSGSHYRANSINAKQTHYFAPLTKDSITVNKTPAQAKDIAADLITSAPILPLSKGATIPAASQATAKLAQNSAKALPWSLDKPLINSNSNTDKDNNVNAQWTKVIYLKPTGHGDCHLKHLGWWQAEAKP